MIRAVVFDLWNTLVHSPGGSPFKRVRTLLDETQQASFPAFMRDAMTRACPDAAAFVAAWREPLALSAAQAEAIAAVFATAGEEALLFPEVAATLERTRELGRIALLSNTQTFDLGLLDALDLRRHFRVLGLSAELGALKPEAAAFEAIQKRLALFPGNLVMVGDSWTDDVEGALAAGWTAIWVNREGKPRPDHDPDADLVEVSDLALVPEVVARLQAGARCSTCLG